jgi:aminoglycoside phosphotransferase (APT) family kinase protein
MHLLQRDVARHAGATTLPGIAHLKTLPNPYSDVHVFQLDGPSENRRLYVKVPHPGAHGLDRARQRLHAEFTMLHQLQSLEPSAPADPFGTAEPLNYYPDYPALATFEAATSTLREHYRSGARRFWRGATRASLPLAVAHCGQWLRAFQQTTAAGCGPFAVEDLLAYVDIRLQQLVTLNGLDVSETLAQDIRSRVRSVAVGIPPGTHRLCARHNDFASHNILARGERIWVIDFSMVDTGSYAFDPATFWLDLDMLKADPSHDAGFIDELQGHFLHAYGGISPDCPAFALVRCQYQLNRVLTLHGPLGLPTPGALYRRSVVRQCLSGLRAFAAG